MEGGQKINHVATKEIMDREKKKTHQIAVLKKTPNPQSKSCFSVLFHVALKIKISVVFQLSLTL